MEQHRKNQTKDGKSEKDATEAPETIIGYEDHTRRNGWFDVECQHVRKKKNEAREKILQHQTRSAVELYQNRRKEEKLIYRTKKEDYHERQIEEVSRSFSRENRREVT